VEHGEAEAAIKSLFDETLGGWRAQGFAEQSRHQDGGVAGALTGRFRVKELRDEHVRLARSLGSEATPREVWLDLLGRASQTFYRAPMHGDLHPGNVFVRQRDAILIDLASVQQGPLSADPACLEVALIFERRAGDELAFDEWRSAVDRLYGLGTFRKAPDRQSGNDLWVNRWNSAREVRAIGLAGQACSDEYLTAVAVYLLRRGMHPADDEHDALRRAYAIVTAGRIVQCGA
jgi:hypothetical protein